MAAVPASLQTILDATEALIREKGCRQTTLQDIIRRTGLSKGAIYHYVSGKDELLGLVLKSRAEQMDGRFAEIAAKPAPAEAAQPLRTIAEGMVRSFSHDDVTNLTFIYLLSRMDNDKVKAIVQEVYAFTSQTCARWIDTGKRHGAIPPAVDAQKVGDMFVMFMYGLQVQNAIRQEQPERTAKELIALMSRALGQP